MGHPKAQEYFTAKQHYQTLAGCLQTGPSHLHFLTANRADLTDGTKGRAVPRQRALNRNTSIARIVAPAPIPCFAT